MRRSLSNRHWGGALYLALSQGMPDADLRQELSAGFANLEAQGQKTQMNVFFQLVDHLMQVGGSHDAVELLLETYLQYVETLRFRFPDTGVYCRINARLYLSAAYTHAGRTVQAARLLQDCEAQLPQLLRYPENRDLYFIVRNREAIIYQDCYCYDKTMELLDESLCVAELEQENLRQLYSILKQPVEDAPSEQQAKLLGSRALTYQYMLPSHPELAGEAREAALRAIDSFAYPKDKRRHQMTLAEIELRCGNLKAAQMAFMKGLGCNEDTLLTVLAGCESPFDWYHAIRLADGLCDGTAEQRTLARQIFQMLRTQFNEVFREIYPAHSALRRAGLLCLKLGESRGFARSCFSKCESLCFQPGNQSGALWAIGLACLADRIVLDLRDGSVEPALTQRFSSRLEEAMGVELLEEMRDFYQGLSDGLEKSCGGDMAERITYYRSVSDIVGG